MDGLFQLIGDVSHSKLGGGDSFSDQLNCKYTVFVLSLFAVMSTTRIYVDEPINCYCPDHFTGSQVDFTNKVCWTTNTYFLPFTMRNIPGEYEPKTFISYYQWVSLFLSLQAFLFYLPRPLWKMINKKSGLVVSNITDAAIHCQKKTNQEEADKVMRYMTKQVGRYLQEMKRLHQSKTRAQRIYASVHSSYLICAYLFIKILYIVNVVGQLFLLNSFLGTDYHLYGFDVMRRMIKRETWSTSDRFPRVTMCDFKIRVLGNIHRYTVQCALPLNLFFEIMFIFIWFWFVFVSLMSVCSFVIWCVTALSLHYYERYIYSRLQAMGNIIDFPRSETNRFVRNYLHRDGCFIIRMVAKNTNDVLAAEFICGLWEHYLEHKTDQRYRKNSLRNNPAIEKV